MVISVDMRAGKRIKNQHLITLDLTEFNLEVLKRYCTSITKTYNLTIYDGIKIVKRSNLWLAKNGLERTYNYLTQFIQRLKCT